MIYLLIIVFALLQGATDGILYSRKGSDAFSWNEKAISFAQLAVIVLVILAGAWYDHVWLIVLEIAAGMLAYCYFYTGICSVTRKEIVNTVPFHWGAAWKAPSTLSYKIRFLLFVSSLVLMAIGIIAVNQ